MEVSTRYVIYKLKPIMGSDSQALVKVLFKGFDSNMFETEQEAIDCLVKNGMTFNDYIILKQVYITDF